MAKRKTLAEQTDERLRKAGVEPDDPALAVVRAWNRDVFALAAGSVLSERERSNGKQR